MIRTRRWIAAAAGIVLCAGCAAWNPMRNTPPSSSQPWAPPELPRDSADLVQRERASEPGTAAPVFSPDSQQIYFQSDKEGKSALYRIRVERFVEKTEPEV